ncbi:MAG: phage tail sheath family protein [Paludibacteraceae bacterium]|nr:phage tail sheath family protein [Paludibacteraceae bacterium]
MSTNYKTPGVFVEEVSKFPPSVAGVATAIPAFIGFTEKVPDGMTGKTVKVSSLVDYVDKFGEGPLLTIENGEIKGNEFCLYDSIRLFYDNGGGTCYICSVGLYDTDITTINADKYKGSSNQVFTAMEKIDEITLVLFPDAAMILKADQLGALQQAALKHCGEMKDRFAILDVKDSGDLDTSITNFREKVGSQYLSYGAAYYPYVKTTYTKDITFDEILSVIIDDTTGEIKDEYTKNLTEKEKLDLNYNLKNYEIETQKVEKNLLAKALMNQIPGYSDIMAKYQAQASIIPASGAIAGIYCATDSNKGVWQSPANISIASVSDIKDRLSDSEQENLNIDVVAGKSVNAIRYFNGKGIIVWGARTLDGNSNEWRYVSVRRLFNYIEESVQKSTNWAVFQPNDANTWVKVQCQIENFLSNLWRDGALAGSTPEKAFFVKVGQDVTMTANDVLEGKLIVEIGIAAVRPAEFIILKFSHKLQEA